MTGVFIFRFFEGFLGKVKFDEFLGAYLGERPGNIVDAHNGNVIGRHRGLWFHTVGQVKILNDGMHFFTQKNTLC